VPSAFVNPFTRLAIAAGALVRVDVLLREVEETGTAGRVCVDSSAGVIEDVHIERERSSEYLARTVGSTLQGVGEAMVDRVRRVLKLARDVEVLREMTCDVAGVANEYLDLGYDVLVEGTQGTFLSLYHGTYPYVTSRDTTGLGIPIRGGYRA
jgi:adenylosuccinate synthase